MATVYRTMGKFDKAEPLYVECHRISEKVKGPDDRNTLICMNNLANLYSDQKVLESYFDFPCHEFCVSTLIC